MHLGENTVRSIALFLRRTLKRRTMKCDINESLNSLGLILVPLNVNGNRHMFLLDTGSQQNGVSDAWRIRTKLPPSIRS